MYLSNVKYKNYGPLEEVNLEIRNKSEENPNPIVLIGQNGSGKTLFLSNILHALIEMKRKNEIIRVKVDVGGVVLCSDITVSAEKELNLNIGKEVYVGFKAMSVATLKL